MKNIATNLTRTITLVLGLAVLFSPAYAGGRSHSGKSGSRLIAKRDAVPTGWIRVDAWGGESPYSGGYTITRVDTQPVGKTLVMLQADPEPQGWKVIRRETPHFNAKKTIRKIR